MVLYDNKDNKVSDFLEMYLEEGASLRLVSAYFTVQAFFKLRNKLNGLKETRFLFGEPRFIQKINQKETEYQPFKIEGESIKPSYAIKQSLLAKACKQWIEKDSVHIKSVKQSGLLHGKMYYVTSKTNATQAIIGSSNFTEAGLGFSQSPNIELNMTVEDRRDCHDLEKWFDSQWCSDNLVEDVKAKVLYYLEQLYQKVSPKTLYYKTLFHLFERHLEDNQNVEDAEAKTRLPETVIWQALYGFQKQAVRLALSKLEHYGGCIIADSVGLGKTYEALAVIKAFENKNKEVLVLCPKKLERNWKQFIEKRDTNPLLKDRFSYTVKPHSIFSTQEETAFAWNHFELIVIDESHHFRNESASRFQKLLDVMKTSKPKVLLLSATPVNNNLNDLKNQLRFIASDESHHFDDDILGISNFKTLLDHAQREYKAWYDSKGSDTSKVKNLQECLPIDYFKLCDEIIIARSRKHIETFYKEDLEKLGAFPRRLSNLSYKTYPLKIGDPLCYEELAECFEDLTLASYKRSDFIKPEYRERYRGMNHDQIVGLLKIGLFKRLESSVSSFASTLTRMIERIENIQTGLEHAKFDRDILDINDLFIEDDTLLDAMETHKYDREGIPLEHIDIDTWQQKLRADRELLESMFGLVQDAQGQNDGKLEKLKTHIQDKLKQNNRKVLVFTQYSDTASYLYKELKELLPHASLGLVTGTETKATCGAVDFESILSNFSPRSKKRLTHQEIDILVATDCISEGQNLQDCDQVVNYDIHWNPVRLIQRFGRIDRLNSQNKAIQMVNFWPTETLEDYLKLERRISGKSELANLSTSGNDNVLSDESVEYDYRKKQFEIIEDESGHLENVMKDDLDFSSHSFNDFITELLQFLGTQKEALRKMPLGLHAIVESETQASLGTIFCLKQTVNTKRNKHVNAFNPYYLIYVTEKGIQGTSIKTRAEAFETLNLYRQLCKDKHRPNEELSKWFDERLENQNNDFDNLLKRAIASLSSDYKHQVEKLIDNFDIELPQFNENEAVTDESSLELVTWLIIR
jgi:superfamily II DNA or RNA helicase